MLRSMTGLAILALLGLTIAAKSPADAGSLVARSWPVAGPVIPVQLSTSERAAELERVYEELSSENPFMRRAAFEIASQSDDPLIVKFAIDAALDSDDVDLRTDGLRQWLSMRERLSVELELPSSPTPEQRELFDESQPAWFEVTSVDARELELRFRGHINNYYSFQGGFIPGGLRVDARTCRLELMVLDRRELAGAYSCGSAARLLATVDVQ